MKEVARDREMLARLAPEEVEAYLRGTGWELLDVEEGRASYWRRTDERSGEEFDAFCVLDPTFRDFPQRMAELLHTVGTAEQRSPNDVYASIAAAAHDVAEWQIQRTDAQDGSIPLKDGARAFEGVMRLYAAAAAAEETRRPYFGRVLAGKALQLVSQTARLGQTRVGSYVISVSTRLPPLPRQRTLPEFPEDVPYERRVMVRMAEALGAARQAAISQNLQAFERSVEHGVSADLCEAVTHMAEGEAFTGLNVSLKWSWLRPVPLAVPTALSFSPELVRNMAEGGAHLRFRHPRVGFRLIGKVVRLEKWPHEPAGTVGIDGWVDSDTAMVAVALSAEDYAKAHTAHKAEALVVCRGELKRTGRGYVLLGAHDFAIIEDTPSGIPPATEPESV